MPLVRRIQTNFSKGELSPLLEGRPDLIGSNEGCRTLENFILKRQACAERRVGTRFVNEVAVSSVDTMLIPFEAGISNPIMIEIGSGYVRFYKNRVQLQSSPGVAVQITLDYNDTNLRTVHFTQSVDVLFLFHRLYRQRRLNRVSDLNWSVIDITHRPPPSFEKDVDISDSLIVGDPGGGQGTNTPPEMQPGSGGVGGGGDSGTDGGDGGGGDGGGDGDGGE